MFFDFFDTIGREYRHNRFVRCNEDKILMNIKKRYNLIKTWIKLFAFNKLQIKDKKICGRAHLSIDEANELLFNKVKSNIPFALCRFGTTEMGFFAWWEEHELFGTKRYKRHIEWESHPTEDEAKRWVDSMKEVCSKADIMAHFRDNPPYEEYIFSMYAKHADYIRLDYMEPINAERPWTLALEGKRVLVVSPFYKQIAEQYKRRDKVYQGKQIFPEMDLITIPSVWYADAKSGKEMGYDTWFDALYELYDNIMAQEFDIALLSCGSMGFNLATMIKDAGRSAIHFGGALQMLFGVMGSRWENSEMYRPWINEYWVRADASCAPNNKRAMEIMDEGCYW